MAQYIARLSSGNPGILSFVRRAHGGIHQCFENDTDYHVLNHHRSSQSNLKVDSYMHQVASIESLYAASCFNWGIIFINLLPLEHYMHQIASIGALLLVASIGAL